MTDRDVVAAAQHALADHEAFEEAGGAFEVTTTPFDARVTGSRGDEGVRYLVTVRVPTLSSAVEGEAVADVVEEGWFETFERRVTSVGGVTRVEPETPVVEQDEVDERVEVRIAFETDEPSRGASDAKALVEYVEGTYLQGVVPGYDYREPVAGLLERAGERSEGEGRPSL